MPKAVSFAAVLDPALLLKDDRAFDGNNNTNGEKRSGNGKKKEEKASTNSRNSSDGQSGRISTNDSTTEEIITRTSNRKGKAKARDDDDAGLILDSVNHRKTCAKLRMALAGESPNIQRIGPLPVHDEEISADITESIYDFSTTMMRTTSAPSAILQPSSSLSGRLSSLAQSLASEEANKRKTTDEHSKRQWDDIKRRTLYGSERRKLERQSRRMSRNPKAKMMQNMGETIIGSPSELRRKGSPIVPVLSQNDLELFKDDGEPAVFSQQSNFSVETDDGKYHTQFSFFHFDSEQAEEESEQSPQAKEVKENDPYSESFNSSGVQTQTQAAYYADRSASCSLSDPQSSTTVNQDKIPSSIPSQRVIITRESTMPGMVQAESFLDQNATAQQRRVPPATIVEQEDFFSEHNEAGRRRLRALCLDEIVNNHKVRRVRPTIWQGQKIVEDYFGPLLNPFVPSRSPPARADLCRWAEWMDSQSDNQLQSTSPADLYDFQGIISDIPYWSE